jgi:uncharacterized protein (DUF2267 family)
MQYRELVKRVQNYSGFSDVESEQALRLFVNKLSSRLNEEEREDFASELPEDLDAVALEPETTETGNVTDFIRQFCEAEDIEEGRAKKQIYATWLALKEAISPGEIRDIRAQLPNDLAVMLY